MDRREFLVSSLTTCGALLVGTAVPNYTEANESLNPMSTKITPLIEVSTSGAITVYLYKQEMGQGIATGIAMITAEEMGGKWEDVNVKHITFDKNYEDIDKAFSRFDTGGSYSMRDEWEKMRGAGALANLLLCQAAAEVWQEDIKHCYASQSQITNKKNGKSISFSKLAPLTKNHHGPLNLNLKSRDQYSLVGTPRTQLQAKAITQAKHKYGIDTEVSNMVHALIIRPPVLGTRAKRFDSRLALKVRGVIDVFEVKATERGEVFDFGIRGGIAVVADSCWTCLKAVNLVSVEWTLNHNSKRGENSFFRDIEHLKPFDWTKKMVADTHEDKKDEISLRYTAQYSSPYIAHQLMEPLNAIAHFRSETDIEVWAGSQSPNHTATNISETYGVEKRHITFNPLPMGGGYGRRYFADFVIEALELSKRVRRPVKLMWTREDEVRFGAYHPLRKDKLSASLDNRGNIISFHANCASTHRWAGGEVLFPYGHQSIRVSSYYYDKTLLHTGPWRAVVAHLDIFSREVFMDELAFYAKSDPIQYRLKQLKRSTPEAYQKPDKNTIPNSLLLIKRLSIQVLNLVAELSRWNEKRGQGIGVGVALSAYHSSSICAQVAELIEENGSVRVSKVFCVCDVGFVVNPDSVKAQIEGSILWGLTPVIHGGVSVEKGEVTQSNFHDMPILRMKASPKIIIKLVNLEERKPQGVGECAVPPIAPAIHNAYFNLTGRRTRNMHLKTL